MHTSIAITIARLRAWEQNTSALVVLFNMTAFPPDMIAAIQLDPAGGSSAMYDRGRRHQSISPF
jgi:hypothetical protein